MHAKPDLRVNLKWMIARSGSVITDVIWLKQMKTLLSKFTLMLLICFGGCTAENESASQTNTAVSGTDQTIASQSDETPVENVAPNVKPGFYRDGADFDRVSDALAGSDANILLDYHSGIEWYDKTSKTRSTLDGIDDVRPLLASIENKRLVTVSTGKAAWDKYDEYIAKVAEFAGELGFDMTIVTDDNAQGLVISKVIQHKK